MRKAGNLRNYKKVKNTVDDEFYMSWLGNERIASKIKNISTKKLNCLTARVKQTIDKTYLLLKVEEKYKYYVNLYLLYDMCCLYFNLENGLKKYLEQTLENREEFQATYRDIEKILGYEPIFNQEIYHKASDGLRWLTTSLKTILKYYVGRVKEESIPVLSREVENYISNVEVWEYKREEDGIDREIAFINMILLRIKYAREHIDIIYSLNKNFETEDKKLRTMIKSSLTRIEKPIKTIIGYIEELYTEETA